MRERESSGGVGGDGEKGGHEGTQWSTSKMPFVNVNDSYPTPNPRPPAAPRASASSARVRSSACSLSSLLMSPASEASAAGPSAPPHALPLKQREVVAAGREDEFLLPTHLHPLAIEGGGGVGEE